MMRTFSVKEGIMSVYPVREDILRIVYTKKDKIKEPTEMIEKTAREEAYC